MQYCPLCKVEIVESSMKEHESSILHLFQNSPTPKIQHITLPASNRGYQLLSRMGWKKGDGLGIEKEGILHPIATEFKTDRTGLGRHKKKKRITHFPAHGIGNSSEAKRMQDVLGKKRKTEEKLTAEMKKETMEKRKKEMQREKKLRAEVYSDLPDEYQKYM